MEKCKRHSHKREAILECIRSTDCHPAAEWVYTQVKAEIPNISLATVYRNLAQFRAEGMVRVVGHVDGEERYDCDLRPHDHFVCRCCGKITDVPVHIVSDEDVAKVGRVDGYDVTFYGCCEECLKKEKAV